MAACVLLHMTGVLEFRNAVTFTHILMAMDILYLGYALVHYVKKHGMDRSCKDEYCGNYHSFCFAFLCRYYIFLCYFNCCGYSGKNRIPCLYLSAGMACKHQIPWKNFMKDRKSAIYKELALKDILTGLYSRNAYDEWERDNQHPDKTAIVMLDLNNLKKCNDRYGHEAGDTYLKKGIGDDHKCIFTGEYSISYWWR